MSTATEPGGDVLPTTIASVVADLPGPAAAFDLGLRRIAESAAWRAFLDERRLDLPPAVREAQAAALVGTHTARERDPWTVGDQTEFVTWRVGPWRDLGGRVAGSIVHLEIVTDRVALARRLEEREDFIRAFFDRSPIGLNLCRMDGLWLESNPAFLDIIGYDQAEADGGLTYWQLTPRRYDAAEAEQLASLRASGRYGPYEKEFIRKDGRLVPVRLNGFTIEKSGETFIWSLIEDISERRRLEHALNLERGKAVQAAKLATLGEMAAGFAHEINNPLTIIDGYAHELEYMAASGRIEPFAEAVSAIRTAVDRAAKIVVGLRRFARQGASEPPSSVSLIELLDDAVDLCRRRIESRGVALAVHKLDVEVIASPIEIVQVLVNLLNNAFDAAAEGGDAWIRVEATLAERQVEIRVRDSGPGVPEELRDRVFEPFFTTKPVGQGTGLGLSISRGIVERLGGELAYEAGGASTFVVRLRRGAR